MNEAEDAYKIMMSFLGFIIFAFVVIVTSNINSCSGRQAKQCKYNYAIVYAENYMMYSDKADVNGSCVHTDTAILCGTFNISKTPKGTKECNKKEKE